jgi:osmotically-inducible protein OsmY
MKTDAQIKIDVLAELEWEPSVDATRIGVEVKDGVVTLAGHVSSFWERWHAERAAQRVAGVNALAVEIDIALPGFAARTDGDIAHAIEQALQWVSYLPKDAVKVMVEKGWVTLTGKVDWDYQRQAATGAVRYLMGVRGVTDDIGLSSRATSKGVKADLEATLGRRLPADRDAINVRVDAGEVTLAATVHSWWARELARESAWSTPGVHYVQDRLAISA